MAAAGLVLVGIFAFQAIHHKDASQYYSVTNWSPETSKAFFESCTYTAKRPGSGVSDQDAKVYCGCDIDTLQTLYKSDDELGRAEKSWVTNGYPAEVVAALRACASKTHTPLNI